MRAKTGRKWQIEARRLARRQHWVITRSQLLTLGATDRAIKHRLRSGRLFPLFTGVYSVGRPDPGRLGWLMAATLAGGPGAVLSHWSAAGLWGFASPPLLPIEVSVPGSGGARRRKSLVIHRRRLGFLEGPRVRRRDGIPLSAPAETVIDLASRLAPPALDRMISEADKLSLLTPATLRAAAVGPGRRRGSGIVRRALDRHEFRLSDSDLERYFLPLARKAGVGTPLTRQRINGHRVDFWFPDLGLVIETDGLTYHRTPIQQRKDRIRDQDHAAAGLHQLRFTHWQVRYDRDRVVRILGEVGRRIVEGRR